MKIRSMTGYAQVKSHVDDQLTVTLSLKSVNHRFLDLHLRIPSELDAVEMKVRRILKPSTRLRTAMASRHWSSMLAKHWQKPLSA